MLQHRFCVFCVLIVQRAAQEVLHAAEELGRLMVLAGMAVLVGFIFFAPVAWSGGGPRESGALTEANQKNGSAARGATAGAGVPRAASKDDLRRLHNIDQKHQKHPSVTMTVQKTVRVALLDQVRKAKGRLLLSSGRLRMELDGQEKTLLVINKKHLWAVTFPPEDFKTAAVQVIKRNMSQETGKPGKPKNIIALLMQGGLSKFFKVTGVKAHDGGGWLYFLEPSSAHRDFKRAQLVISRDEEKLEELRYWDERDNETELLFSDIVFGNKLEDNLFTYSPPPNADVMEM